MMRRTGSPVVVAGFEPLDILAAIVKLTELVLEKRPEVFNAYPRCVTAEGSCGAARLTPSTSSIATTAA